MQYAKVANFKTGSELNLLYQNDQSDSSSNLDAYSQIKPLKVHHLGFWEWGFLLSQIVVIIIYGKLTAYSPKNATDIGLYPYFQDVHVMIFIGFGFLMTFVKQMPWTSLSFNWILSIWAIEWAILSLGIWNGRLSGVPNDGYIALRISLFIKADFAAASAMIMYGAILGKCNLQQAFFLVHWMMWCYGLNDALCNYKFHVMDVGGSLTIHTFGAYFGLAASYFFQPKRAIKSKNLQTSHQSETIAMIGSIFLWMFWPSFNGALVSTAYVKQRTIINTILSIGGSCIGAMSTSRILLGKLDMEIMLNATLAGGVAIGSLADFLEQPWVAISIGTMAGIISALGFQILSGLLQKRIGLHDTCGVHNLHGIPGVFSAIMSMIVIGCYEHLLYDPESFPNIYNVFNRIPNWTLRKQAAAQIYSLLVTLALSISTGLIGGYIASRKFFSPVHALFKDSENFHHVMQKYPKSYLKYGDEHYETALDLILIIKNYMIMSKNLGQNNQEVIENMINHIWNESNFDLQIDQSQTKLLIEKMFQIIDKTVTVSNVGFQQLFQLIDQHNQQLVVQEQVLEFINDFIKC